MSRVRGFRLRCTAHTLGRIRKEIINNYQESSGSEAMPIKKELFLKQFSQQALDERISLFIGAGGSCDAGYPNWVSLFTPFAKDLGTTIDESTDYYRLAQYYSNKFGQAELRKRINERINKNNFESPLLEELIDIGFTNVWTTNFDNIIELNYQKRNILTNKVFRDSDLSNIDINRRINIFKMNGDVTNLEGIVATQSDYERYSDTHRIMLMFFKKELISSTFLFIGYSFTDHLVLNCLGEITRYLGDSATYHYTIMKNDQKNPYFEHFIEDIEQRYHMRVLLVDEYRDIPNVLTELNKRIRNKRVFVSGAFTSCMTEIEEYSHNLSRNLTSHLLKNDYRIVNGIGSRFGTHLIGYANEHLAKNGIKDIEKYLIVKPFVGHGEKSLEEKKSTREEVISKCGAAIFVFGEVDGNSVNTKSGVLEEFEIACAQHKTIIPISYPDMISQEIWQKVKCNLTRYPYLEGKIDLLTSIESTDVISNIIIHILDSMHEVR